MVQPTTFFRIKNAPLKLIFVKAILTDFVCVTKQLPLLLVFIKCQAFGYSEALKLFCTPADRETQKYG